jgi:antitoxin ParD1/3/4
MARNTSVSLGDHFTAFIDQQVGSGRYATASDVVRAALRLLEREQQMNWLRGKIAEADADYRAGNVIEVDDRFWDDLEQEVSDRAARGEKPSDEVLP